MVYEIGNKIFIKIENYYIEVEIKAGEVVRNKNRNKIYDYELQNETIKEYTVSEYSKKKNKEKLLEKRTKDF